jgi:hypothetical protein
MAERFSTRPSRLLGIADECVAFAFDAAALEQMTLVEIKANRDLQEQFEQ